MKEQPRATVGEIAGQLVKDGEVMNGPSFRGRLFCLHGLRPERSEAERQYGKCWDCGIVPAMAVVIIAAGRRA